MYQDNFWKINLFKYYLLMFPNSTYSAFYFTFLCRTLKVHFFPFVDNLVYVSLSSLLQISRASLAPESSYIAKPAASWLDDFLVWLSPEAFGCCRKFINGSYCPPDDQVGACSICQIDYIQWKSSFHFFRQKGSVYH